MATQRIESGQMQLRSVGGVPMTQITPREVDYVGVRAQAETANTLSKIVDRMSQSAFEMAGKAVQERAMFDVATNRLTPEQLEIAKNGDMAQLGIGSSNFNLYDATVRKARSFELASAFDKEAKSEIVKIMDDVQNGRMTSEQAGVKINNLSNGYSNSLAKADPDASLKLAASIGVYANTVMAEAYKAEQTRNKEKQGLLVDSDFTNTMKLVEPALAQGFYVDANGAEQPIEQLLAVHRKNLSDSAFAAGGLTMANQYLAKFDAQVAEAKINAATKVALGDEYMADPVVGLNLLRSGNLGRMSGVFMNMPQDDKNKVVANFMVAINQRDSAEKTALENQKQAALAEFVPLYNEAIAMPGNGPKRKQLIAQLTAISNANPNVVPITLMGSLLKPDSEGAGNELLFFNLREAIWSGSITDPKQISSLVNKGITGKQANTLLEKFISTDQAGDAYLSRGISQLAGIPVIPGHSVVVDPKGQEFKRRLQLEADAAQISAQAARDGKVLTPRQVLEQLTKDIDARRNSEGAKQARDQLTRNYETKPWINGPITRDNLSALEIKAGNEKEKLNDLKRIRTLLDQAEGN
jgi:hypothetical protein